LLQQSLCIIDKNIKTYFIVVYIAFTLILLTCFFIGMMALVTVGDKIEADIFHTYPDEIIIKIFSVVLCVSISVSYTKAVHRVNKDCYFLFVNKIGKKLNFKRTPPYSFLKKTLTMAVISLIITFTALINVSTHIWISYISFLSIIFI